MYIPEFLSRDEYLQNPMMHRFLKQHRLHCSGNQADLLKRISDYADISAENKAEVSSWLLKCTKEGTKDICYKKIYGAKDTLTDPALIEVIIARNYPDCPHQNILTYHNTSEFTLINYEIITDTSGQVSKLEFVFSQLFYYGEVGHEGKTTIFPLYVDIDVQEGFIISRGKAKSTLFTYDECNPYLDSSAKIDTIEHAVLAIDHLIEIFNLQEEKNPKILLNSQEKMLFNLYNKYSFTPQEIDQRVNSQTPIAQSFIDQVFRNLNLSSRNKPAALMDLNIFLEKFISINGDTQHIFKNDRPAYLFRISTNDNTELTKIDTTSPKYIPLQCTEAFFDSKKSVMRSKTCKRLNLIFKRTDDTIFGKHNPLVVQLEARKNYGYVKTMQYAEEADIQNVLQAVFENY